MILLVKHKIKLTSLKRCSKTFTDLSKLEQYSNLAKQRIGSLLQTESFVSNLKLISKLATTVVAVEGEGSCAMCSTVCLYSYC